MPHAGYYQDRIIIRLFKVNKWIFWREIYSSDVKQSNFYLQTSNSDKMILSEIEFC